MKKVLRWFGIVVGALIAAFLLFVFAARFADGPVGMLAGGPFSSGERALGAEPDWSFVRDVRTVEFQLEEPARSRTTWILEHEGRIYVPSGGMNRTIGKLWKQWPIEAEKDGRAILRVRGKLYERQLRRVKDPALLKPLVARLAEKYGVAATMDAVDSGYLWLFEMAPRG